MRGSESAIILIYPVEYYFNLLGLPICSNSNHNAATLYQQFQMMKNMRLWLVISAFGISAGVNGTVVTNETAVAADKTFDYVIVGAGLAGISVGNKACIHL